MSCCVVDVPLARLAACLGTPARVVFSHHHHCCSTTPIWLLSCSACSSNPSLPVFTAGTRSTMWLPRSCTAGWRPWGRSCCCRWVQVGHWGLQVDLLMHLPASVGCMPAEPAPALCASLLHTSLPLLCPSPCSWAWVTTSTAAGTKQRWTPGWRSCGRHCGHAFLCRQAPQSRRPATPPLSWSASTA